ncbi:tyrosine-type recombinase/integrase [Paralcaligenes sp. KSB-10]|uniref:tyrosine-type recombinase/integrase n=1 Tax=Paralcaligenes sp. KSB-10 TaxID=2901142 RepID=UPI001E48B38E|nr:integrase arm-type DNA-binding domain-containing protein [Paralcaligenes sp. KSB-10]UHL65574.1 tyrosine-type recombinase/integrase [Paralcaligenes sp. KSB-10]
MALTDTTIRQKARPQASAFKLTDGGGLFLYVTPAGSRLWRWKYRHGGKERLMSFGAYPDVSLAQARELHRQGRAVLATGIDPMAARKAEKQTDAMTFQAVAEKWYRHWKPGKTAKHAKDVWHRLELDILPTLGSVPAGDLTAANVRDCVKAIEVRGALDIAKRQLQKCSQIMRYAVAHDLAERNPVADIQPSDILPARKKRNYARLDAKDLPQLLRDMDAYVGGEHTRLALQLMALTFVRTGELIGAKWGEFDLDAARWNIPAERMKMRTPHIVPLSKQAVAVLEKLQAVSYDREFVFPADTGKPTHMSNNTILYALYRMGYRGRMTGHGFRGIASTILHEQGFNHAHIELQLAHQERDNVSAAYNHALYLVPRAKMMQVWADHLDALRVENVVAIRRA